jgi:hypothetical protein
MLQPENLGPFVTYDEALTAINDLLGSAASDLALGVLVFHLT